MAYRIISGRPFEQEIKRLFDQQIRDATSGLTQPAGADAAQRVHATRKHIKKARALLQVARQPLGRRYVDDDDQLRTVSRALGPRADAHRSLETLAATCREGIVQLQGPALSAVRAQLEARAAASDEEAVLEDLRRRVVRLLDSVRMDVASAEIASLDRAAIVAELRASHAAARKARRRAHRQPSVATFHRWRRHVKREWHLFRLIADITGDRLKDERQQLAALDACLGELHDVDVLIGAVTANSPLSRTDMAKVLKSLRAHVHDLRRLARRLSAFLDERPESMVKRVRVLWGATPRQAAVVRRWRHSA